MCAWHLLFGYTIEMEESTKISHDLDESEYKSCKSCVLGKKSFNYICLESEECF